MRSERVVLANQLKLDSGKPQVDQNIVDIVASSKATFLPSEPKRSPPSDEANVWLHQAELPAGSLSSTVQVDDFSHGMSETVERLGGLAFTC